MRHVLSCSFAVVVLVACGTEGRDTQGAWVGMTQGDDDGDDGVGETADLDDGGETVNLTLADDDAGDDDGPDDDSGHTAVTEMSDSGDEDPSAGDDDPSAGDGTAGVECPENCYCEPIDPEASLDDLEAGYSSADWANTIFEVLGRRWPAGRDLLVDEQDDPYFGAFSDTSSFASLMDGLMTEAHEGTHGWDYGHAGVDDFAYFLRGDLQFFPQKLHGFDRSEIYGMVEGTATDLYKGTYLTGTQGTYGFYELLDEMNCYINGMAAIGVTGEYIPYGVSGRDGAVAFMYYLELYLKLARTQYPDVYAQIQNDPDYVEMIRIQWLRLHFLKIYAADLHPHIGLYDDAIEALMYAEENQSEIEMLIGHELEASNCLP
jgi:hypothetical protein